MYQPFHEGADHTARNAQSTQDRFKGAAFTQNTGHQNWERCVIHEVYPDRYTCDVFTEQGRFLAGVPWPLAASGTVIAPSRDENFAVHYNMGAPQLTPASTNTRTQPTGDREEFKTSPAQGVGGSDPVYSNKGSNNARGSLPRDVVAGDWMQVGDTGNMMGVLSGGVSVMKASELAQVIAAQARNMLKLIGQNFSLYTGAGTVDFITEGGKTSMVLRAGADNETESDPSAENFRIRCELGDEGEMVDFRVTDGKGRNVYRLHVDPDGRVDREALRETNIIEEDRRTEIGGNDVTQVGGNKIDEVAGSMAADVEGAAGVRSGGSYRVRSGADVAMNALHDIFLNSSRNMLVSAGGQVIGSDPALLFTIANGDVKFNVGSPFAGDAQVRGSSFDVDTFTGSITLNSLVGKVDIGTPIPGGTKIGGFEGVGPFSGVLYELLQVFMGVFGALIDTHVHLIPVLGFTPTLPPLIPPWSSSAGIFPLSRSNFVKLGG